MFRLLSYTWAADSTGCRLPVVIDEFSILYAASKDLVAARQTSDGMWDTTRVLLGQTDDQDGVLADHRTIERLMSEGLLEYGATMVVDITPAGSGSPSWSVPAATSRSWATAYSSAERAAG